ncbi:valine--tRNA ligase [Candidatus Pacearchaeota archaeon]|jgi:valyl-tRNA synthetase|nr:valine--tRNA ligase [Candidatus Pacearchaeota archaeon]
MTENKNDINEIEKECREFWEKEKIYKFDSKSERKLFSIDTPPPTVSGKMHIGHACSYSQTDFIARFMRMKGFEVFYPFGTDDNGLPTERLVEKSRGVKSKDMPRSDFIKLCLDFLKKELPTFIQDWKNVGISCDWDLKYSTIDEHSRKISQWSFLDLHKKGRMYRKDAPAMWCPECRTGVAQVEVQDKEIDSFFNDIIFKIGKEDVTIATTRPELLPACVSLFYHPDDKRYKKYLGKMAKVPLFNFEVPVMEDKRVSMDKGTGIVMCCTFGDQTDMEWQKAYNLPIKLAITEDGKMSSISGKYNNMKIREARKEIIEDLKREGLLLKQIPIKHFVNVHERCGTEIEFVKSKQWFVRYLDLKDDLLKWGNELNWFPDFMKHRYENWVKGLQWDWLVSNQRYFGVSFPVWYCEKCGEVILAKEEQLPVDPMKDKPPVKKCPKCNSEKIIPETDVLNTWFTSSMTPQIVTTLIKDEKVQKKLFPMSLRPQAHEIISFWLFNTLVKSRLHFGKNPWKDAVISGYVTMKGEKMSKSKGNSVAPQEVIEKYGADALRYWAASAKLGDDFDYQEKDLVTGKKLVTKLLNASRFIFMNIKDLPKKPKKLLETDRIFLVKLNEVIKSATKNFENYEYSRAKTDVDNFFWKDFADNYVEIVKARVYGDDVYGKDSALYTLYNSLLAILKMFAPIIPFITEKIYQEQYKKYEKTKSIHICEWPKEFNVVKKKNDDEVYNLLIETIGKVRQEKSVAKKSMNSAIVLFLEKDNEEKLADVLSDLKAVINAEIKTGNFKVDFK